MIFSLFRNNFWDRQNWEKYPVWLYLYFWCFSEYANIFVYKDFLYEIWNAFTILKTWILRYRGFVRICNNPDTHTAIKGDNLTWNVLVQIPDVKFGNLGSIFLLTFNMVKMYFQKSIPYWKWSASSYLSHTWWNSGGLVFLGIRYRGTVFFCGFCPGPGLVNKESHFLELVNIKKNVKQPGFFMRQKIRFTNFYL